MSKPDLNTLTETQLLQTITLTIYEHINSAREMIGISKLYSDNVAEKAIENYFLEGGKSDHDLEECLIKSICVCKGKTIIRISKQFKSPSTDNKTIHDNFARLIEENTINKSMPLMDTNNCYTHIGVHFKFDHTSLQYLIICILSQKIASLEDVISVKDAYILQGQVLCPDYFLYGVKIMKNEKIGYDIAPNIIKFNPNNMKFYIYLQKIEYKDLMMRKIFLYLLNTNLCNIPYLNQNATSSTVPWNQLELGLMQIVDFKKAKDLTTKFTLQSFIMNDEQIQGQCSNNNNNSEVNNQLVSSFGMTQAEVKPWHKTGSVSRITKAKPINSPLVSTPASKGSTSCFFNKNFKGVSTGMMPIQEEPNNALNQSFLNTNQKNTLSPIHVKKAEPNNYFTLNSNNNGNIVNNNISDIIGNQLQKAELLSHNIKGTSINTNTNTNTNHSMTNGFNNAGCLVPQQKGFNPVEDDINMHINNNTQMNNVNNPNNNNMNMINNNPNNQMNCSNMNNQSANFGVNNNNNNQYQNNQFNNTIRPQQSATNNLFNNNNTTQQNRQNPFNNNNNAMNNNNQQIQQTPQQNIFTQLNPQIITPNQHNQYGSNTNMMMNNNNQQMQQQNNNNQMQPNYQNQMIQSNYPNQMQSNNINMNYPMNQDQYNNNQQQQQQYQMNNNQPQCQNNIVNNNNNIKSILQSIKPNTTVTSWQVIPNNIQFKNMVDIAGIGMNYVNNPQKYNFSKDPKYCINLSLYSSGNFQSYIVNPQTKKDFIQLLEKHLLKIVPNQEERMKFLSSNIPIIFDSIKKNHPMKNQPLIKVAQPIQSLLDNELVSNSVFQTKTCIKFMNKILGTKPFPLTNINNNNDSIDHYIFKDSLWTSNNNNKIGNNPNMTIELLKDNQHNNIEDIQKESLNEKILSNLRKKYLTPQEDCKVFNYNPSYEELYRTRNFCDVILSIKQEEIYAHKVVLFSQSPMFKEMIQKTDSKRNKQPELIKIVLPDNFNSNNFHEILKWIYCGSIKQDHTIGQLRDLLLMADNLRIYSLQKILIVKYIIPSMTKEAALIFLRDTYKKTTPNETCDVWNLLATFSLNCISKNSSVLLRTHRNVFLSMEIDLLFKCIELSICYLVEEIHLSSLIKLIIEKGFATDVFDLLMKFSKKFGTCRNYDRQQLNIEQFIVTMNRNEPFPIDYITDEKVTKYSSQEGSNSTSLPDDILNNNQNNNSSQSLFNSHFSFGFESSTSSKENIMQLHDNPPNDIKNNPSSVHDNYSSNSPKTNSVPDFDIRKNKPPSFEFTFQLKPEIFNLNNTSTNHPSNASLSMQPITVFSECFNTNYRSWCLKIDINSTGDVSYYLVERGAPTNQNYATTTYQLNYNSVLFDCAIRDVSFEKNGIIFFSFINNQNQIIGYQNFFNLSQLGKKDTLYFNIWIKEFPLHSACLQHISDNFQPLAIGKKGKCDLKEIYLNNSKDASGKSFYDISPSDFNYILYSDNLRVDNENAVLTALYCYSLNKQPNQIDPLINAIRFEYVDFKMLCTTARDHEVIKKSPQFRHCFSYELNHRIKRLIETKESKESLNITTRPKIKLLKGIKRYYYSGTEEILTKFNIANDLVSFFLEKGHHSGYIHELEKLKKLFDDEKIARDKREQDLIKQNKELKIELQRFNEIENKRKKYDIYHTNNPSLKGETRGEEMMKRMSNCIIF